MTRNERLRACFSDGEAEQLAGPHAAGVRERLPGRGVCGGRGGLS